MNGYLPNIKSKAPIESGNDFKWLPKKLQLQNNNKIFYLKKINFVCKIKSSNQ